MINICEEGNEYNLPNEEIIMSEEMLLNRQEKSRESAKKGHVRDAEDVISDIRKKYQL